MTEVSIHTLDIIIRSYNILTVLVVWIMLGSGGDVWGDNVGTAYNVALIDVMVTVQANLKWSVFELNKKVQSPAQHFDRQRKLLFPVIHLAHCQQCHGLGVHVSTFLT